MTAPGRLGAIHVHSDFSHDGKDPLEQLRDFALEHGITFIGLTDHAEDLDRARWTAYVERCAELSDERATLIPGLEWRFAGLTGLHLLALGLTRWIEPATPSEFIRLTRGVAGLTIVAHPILAHYRVPEEVAAGIDAVEVWNASYNTRYLPDPRAVRLLRRIRRSRPEVVGTAGLDQHDSRNDRETRVLVHDATGDPLAALRAGRFTNVGRLLRFDARDGFTTAALGALTAARWAFDGIERVQDLLARTARRVRRGGRGPESAASSAARGARRPE